MGFDYDVVISGAGISMDAPSSLPSGDALALRAWELVLNQADTQDLWAVCAPVGVRFGEGMALLRLEYLMELLGESLPLEHLVSIYRALGDAAPNANHYGLAEAPPHDHYTLNMDTLLETAGFQEHRLTHLHGRWDRPDSIITTIGQYARLLPPGVGRHFRNSLAGKRVLVLGYSGRDLDVFPALLDAAPAVITWVLHPGSTLTEPVQASLDLLADQGSTEVRFVSRTVLEAVGVRGGLTPTQLWRAEPLAAYAAPQRRPSRSKRALGAARVLFELGCDDELTALADLRACEGEDVVYLNKIVARALRRRGENADALGVLLRPPRSLEQAQVWRRNVNEALSLIARNGWPATSQALDRALWALCLVREGDTNSRRARARTVRLQSQIRIAQRLGARGRLAHAERLLRDVVDAQDVRQAIGIPGEVDAVTWLIDVYRSMSRLDEARKLVLRVTELAWYANASQRAFAHWQVAAFHLTAGDLDRAKEALVTAQRIADSGNEALARGWILFTKSEVLRMSGSHEARAIIDGALSDQRTTDRLLRRYLNLSAAEQARIEQRFQDSQTHLQAISARRPGLLRGSLPMVELGAEMVRLRIQAEKEGGSRELEARIQALRQAYERAGAAAGARDAALLARRVFGATGDEPARHNAMHPPPEEDSGDWWRRPWVIVP